MASFELPQRASDQDRDERRAQIEYRRDDYVWVSDTGLPPHALQLAPSELLDRKRKRSLFPRVAHAYLNRWAATVLTAGRRWSSLDDFRRLFPLAERPALLDRWDDDSEFGRQRLAGVSPLAVAVCETLPDNFRVTDRDVAGLLPNGATLQAEAAERRLFLCNYFRFERAQCVPGRFLHAPIALFHRGTDHQLRPIAIQLGQDPSRHPVATPNHGKWPWLYAKLVVQTADHHQQQVLDHMLTCHYCMEPFWVAANRELAPSHPVRELLAPHFRFTMFFGDVARRLVAGYDGTFSWVKATGLGGSVNLMREAYRDWRFDEKGFFPNLRGRGVDSVDVLPDYPYRDDGKLLHDSIDRYVADMLGHFYKESSDVEEDYELQAWIAAVANPNVRGIKCMPGDGRLETVEQLHSICVDLIFRATAHHSAVSDAQPEELCTVPNTPFAHYRDYPSDLSEVDDEYVMEVLPPREQAITQAFMVHVATSPPVYHLASPDTGYWSGHPAARARREDFAAEMKGISGVIAERNRQRIVPYRSLDPAVVGESISN